MSCTGTFSTLRIFSRDISPDNIGETLGVKATKLIPIDKSSKYPPRREWNVWELCSETFVTSNENSEHIEWILNVLSGRQKNLEELRLKQCSTSITNFWDSTGQGGPHLDLQTMELLIDFGLPISWDIYFDRET